MKRLVLLITLLVIGCANPFVKSYRDSTGGIDLTRSPLVELPTGEPKLYQGNDARTDHESMLENGYNLVGFSSFNAAKVDFKNALTQAKNIHAEIVLVYSRYTGTRSGVMPFTLPDTQTSTTTLSGSTSGPGGYGDFSGTARTTTYGSKTVYIPYHIDRFDCLAPYWIKMKPPIFGAVVQDLTPEIRRIIGSNRGVLVIAVAKKSPAFRADVLRGDVLQRMGDVDLYDIKSFSEIVAKFEGQKIIVELLRDGKEFQKEIQLDQRR
jgi:hypothetical protein